MKTLGVNEHQLRKMKSQPGFIAALDQSGGSTPKALRDYGIKEDSWSTEEEMFAIVHQMRTRIITSPAFNGERILGAILFENTMDREIKGQPTADYLWNVKNVVPFLKIDKGLAAEKDGVQLMKPMPQLAALLDKARSKRIFGTKMRSVIKQANPAGIDTIVNQQFEFAAPIIAAGLVPIVEPEVDIHCPEKSRAETLLKACHPEKARSIAGWAACDAEAHAAGAGQLLFRVRQPSQGGPSRSAFRRLYPRLRPTTVCAEITAWSRVFRGRLSKACRLSNQMPNSTPSSIRSIQSIYEASIT